MKSKATLKDLYLAVDTYEVIYVQNLSTFFVTKSRSNEKLSRSIEKRSRLNKIHSRSNEKIFRSNEKLSRSNEKIISFYRENF